MLAEHVQNRPSQTSEDTHVPAIIAQDAQEAAPGHAQLDISGSLADDITQAPTQILTQQQMIAYHSMRWQQELEREQQAVQQLSPAEQRQVEIANTPTTLFTASTLQDIADASVPDIADMPTLLVPPPDGGTQSEFITKPSSPEADAVHEPALAADNVASTHEENATNTNTTAAAPTTDKSAAQEDVMEQVTDPSGEQPEQAQASSQSQTAQAVASNAQDAQTDFPLLAVGTVLMERYEVAQVITDTPDEHVYVVTDHQGYQRCWNCGAQENAEGDEFCIDCGAQLLDASYNMHEYPAQENKSKEANVLQGLIINTFVEQKNTYVIEKPQIVQDAFPEGVHLLAASASDAGDVRRSEPNEDSTLVLQLQRVHESIAAPAGVFIVADGMGGHDNGQGASRMTIAMIAERMVRELFTPALAAEKNATEIPELDEDGLVALLQGSVEDANTALCQKNQHDKTDMGSTITGFMIVGDHAYILNVGDSRTYMLREGTLHQLTNDHSLVGQLVAGGLIEPDDVYTHPQRSQIYRSLGDKLSVQIDIFKQQVYPGDILLSCSDGLWEMVRNPQIAEILSSAPDPQATCSQLIEAANTNGGEDNVSAVVVFVR